MKLHRTSTLFAILASLGCLLEGGVGVVLDPQKTLVSGDIEIVYQLADWYTRTHPNTSPIGTLFLAHGCHHSATDFWPRTPGACDDCLGLPIETGIVAQALLQGWVVVAVSSVDRDRRCWSSKDLPRIASAVRFVQGRAGLDKNSPVAAIGASSGGKMVSQLSRSGKL